jgi:F-type H+-transporting ATPase subunit a
MVETVCVYLRNDIFKPVLREYTDKFTPILWTFFWFILINNLLGLVPIKDLSLLIAKPLGIGGEHFHGLGGTATQSIWVTASLAVIAFLVINVSAFVKDPGGYFKHLTGGAPVFMWPIMVPVEILGTFVKPFALAMRLFANMTGGHVVIAVMLMFVKLLVDGGIKMGGGWTRCWWPSYKRSSSRSSAPCSSAN